jgi:hypothetical protein
VEVVEHLELQERVVVAVHQDWMELREQVVLMEHQVQVVSMEHQELREQAV